MITFDDSRFPLIIHHWSGTHTEAEIADYFVDLRRHYERAVVEKVVLVTVSHGSSSVGAQERRWIAEGMKTVSRAQLDCYVASYVVAASALQRGVLTALRWFSKDFEKTVAVSSLDEALRLAEETLARHGCQVPPRETRKHA